MHQNVCTKWWEFINVYNVKFFDGTNLHDVTRFVNRHVSS